jgi:glyoxylase-like metal-dependent hydrolase (beta-lactamase superfamily II)
MTKVEVIPLKVPSYLLKNESDFLLIDSGDPSDRGKLVSELAKRDVSPNNLKLVLLTHGDFDHSGNAAFLQRSFGVPIAMHKEDAGMVIHGDQGFNRKLKADRMTAFGTFISFISKMVVRTGMISSFTPDILLEGDASLTEFGFDARVISLPGHSKGSIGLLTTSGELFCGDLLMNILRPEIHFYIDDMVDCQNSIQKIWEMPLMCIYPGHGKPIRKEQFRKLFRKYRSE